MFFNIGQLLDENNNNIINNLYDQTSIENYERYLYIKLKKCNVL